MGVGEICAEKHIHEEWFAEICEAWRLVGPSYRVRISRQDTYKHFTKPMRINVNYGQLKSHTKASHCVLRHRHQLQGFLQLMSVF